MDGTLPNRLYSEEISEMTVGIEAEHWSVTILFPEFCMHFAVPGFSAHFPLTT